MTAAVVRERDAEKIAWGVLCSAFAVFLVIKGVSRFMPKPAPAPPAPPMKDCQYCKTSIPSAAARGPNCTSDLRAA